MTEKVLVALLHHHYRRPAPGGGLSEMEVLHGGPIVDRTEPPGVPALAVLDLVAVIRPDLYRQIWGG